jgi:hypothetical protein
MLPTLRPLSLALLVLACGHNVATAQRLQCTIEVNTEAVAATHKDKLVDFAADVRNYLNGYDWGTESLDQPVVCAINVFVNGVRGDNEYTAQVFIGSQRPVFGTRRNSAVVRLFDANWEFTYIRNRPLNRSPYQFEDLTSFLDFYAYLILGYDFDTYGPAEGAPYFQKASDIASLGRTSGRAGWEQKPGSFTRAQLVEEILNPRNAPARRAMFAYHYTGLDSLKINPPQAYRNILAALEIIGAASKASGTRGLFTKSFFDAKHPEIAEIFSSYPDLSVYDKLAAIDESHRSTYEEALKKRR